MDTGIATSSALAQKLWVDNYFEKYLDQVVFKPYMGTDASAMIHMKEDLARQKGDALTFSLLGALQSEGVQGDSVLEGSEEELPSYSQQVVLNQFRHAVKDEGQLSSQRYPFEIRDAFKPALLAWQQQFVESKIVAALNSIDGILYSVATQAERDTWLAHNADRVLFGAAVSNNAANDHSDCLNEVDSSADGLTPAQITLAKTLAKQCDPLIRPLRMENGEEVFVLFAHPNCTKQLKASDDWKNAQRYAMPRGEMNALFTGALGSIDGVIVVETQKVPLVTGGASSTNVARNFLCGAQALLWAQGGIGGQRMKIVEKEFDYGNSVGVAIASMWNVAKARFPTGASSVHKDHGVFTVYSSGV